MLRFLAPLLVTLSSVTSLQDRPFYTRVAHQSAASEAQIKFAVENKYDDTGPGAKKPEFAYKTYKNLDDALVAYLDDPDTKLPDHERAKAVHKLLSSYSRPTPVSLSNIPDYLGYQKPQYAPQVQAPLSYPVKSSFYNHESKPAVAFPSFEGTNSLKKQPEKKYEPFKFQKFHSIKGSPLSLAHYSRDHEQKSTFGDFDPHPKYSYSYGVHDKSTGDVKRAEETRDGGAVHGFYSYIDPNGHTRTVRYQADDAQGFRATIKKFPGLAK